jgi:hypothetical protein
MDATHESPHQPPRQVQREGITNPDMNSLEQHFPVVARAEFTVEQDGGAYGDEAEYTENIDPVEPAHAGVPHGIGSELPHIGASSNKYSI